jgi:predicted nucleotidyltransferase
VTPDDRSLLDALAAEHPRSLLFTTVSGAHLYGFPSADSDFDLRGVHLARPDELLGLRGVKETITHEGVREGREIDLVTHEARKFFRLMLNRNGYVLEQLHSPLIVRTSSEHEELVALGRRCVTRGHVHHYLGFARNQWGLFSKEDPPRAKPLLYVYRVLLTGIHLMRTGEVNANLTDLNAIYRLPFIDELIQAKATGSEAVRLSDADLAFHRGEYERLIRELEEAGEQSSLPEAPSARPGLESLLLRLRLKSVA